MFEKLQTGEKFHDAPRQPPTCSHLNQRLFISLSITQPRQDNDSDVLDLKGLCIVIYVAMKYFVYVT